MNCKERLEQYIKEDKIYNDWLDENTSYVSDFDKFCIQHCKDIEELLEENNKLKIQISARETLCEEYEQLINTILNFDFFKGECPLNFKFEDNLKEDKAQNIFYNDEYCENNCNEDYEDCWLKYFKELQKVKGDVKNEN